MCAAPRWFGRFAGSVGNTGLNRGHMTKPKSDRSTFIWCDYCNASIRADSIKACLRKTCQTKDKLP